MGDFVIHACGDNNIWHNFAFDILRRYNPKAHTVFIYINGSDHTHPSQKWKAYVLQRLYPDAPIRFIKTANCLSPVTLPESEFRVFPFENYKCNSVARDMLKRISGVDHAGEGGYVLLNQRSVGNRYLYEAVTKLPLGDYLQTRTTLHVKVCNFEDMTPQEQAEACSKARVFISVHGAGTINLIFTPMSCPLLEVNFRKNWFCDPVCDAHYLSPDRLDSKCSHSVFHKSDFHNLCGLLGKPYTEVEAEYYGDGFIDRNPINRRSVYVDGEKLVNLIDQTLAHQPQETCPDPTESP